MGVFHAVCLSSPWVNVTMLRPFRVDQWCHMTCIKWTILVHGLTLSFLRRLDENGSNRDVGLVQNAWCEAKQRVKVALLDCSWIYLPYSTLLKMKVLKEPFSGGFIKESSELLKECWTSFTEQKQKYYSSYGKLKNLFVYSGSTRLSFKFKDLH